MPTFSQLSPTPDGLRSVPQVPRDALRLLWHADFWDGPRSGLLEFNGHRCWFQLIAENPDEDFTNWYRRFAIIHLTPDQLAEEERWHDLFRQHVGGHTDYPPDGSPRPTTQLRPRDQWHRFYDPYQNRTPLDLSANPVLAWFEH